MDGVSVGDVVGGVATLVVGIATIFFAYGYRRQLKLRTADRRINAYADLWSALYVARPTRQEVKGEVLSRTERDELHEQMTKWYFTNGNGMLLTQETRQLYLTAKRNLITADDGLLPEIARVRIARLAEDAREAAHGELAMRQLSLLRTQMKADLDIYGRVYGKELDAEDRQFLRDCNLNPSRKPWRAGRRSPRADAPSVSEP
jgi:hypothetical protein